MNPISIFKKIGPFASMIRSLFLGIHHYQDSLHFAKILICELFIKKGDTILDIGANVGEYTSVFLNMTGDTGMVLAFEPHPMIFRILQKSFTLGQFSNVKTYRLALSSVSDKKIKLRINPFAISGNSTVEPILKNKERMGRWAWDVDVITKQLDDFICENSQFIIIDGNIYPKPSLIKIDVEGHETEVLRGGLKFLRNYRSVIIFEYGAKIGYFEPESIGILVAEGYVVLDLTTFQEVHETYECIITDLVAIPKERYDLFRPISSLMQANRH